VLPGSSARIRVSLRRAASTTSAALTNSLRVRFGGASSAPSGNALRRRYREPGLFTARPAAHPGNGARVVGGCTSVEDHPIASGNSSTPHPRSTCGRDSIDHRPCFFEPTSLCPWIGRCVTWCVSLSIESDSSSPASELHADVLGHFVTFAEYQALTSRALSLPQLSPSLNSSP